MAVLPIEIDASGARAGANRATQALNQIENRAERMTRAVSRSVGRLNQGLFSLRGAVGAIATVLSGRAVLNASLGFERIENSLTAALGSASAGRREFAFVREEADRLGLDLQTAATRYARLAGAARDTTLAGQGVRDIFTSVAATAVVLGLNVEQTRRVLNAFEQILSKGTVSAEEIRQQLGDVLPGAFALSARAIGVTQAALDEMLREGTLASERFLPALALELRETFGPGVQRAVRSTQAQINRFRTALFEIQTEFARSGFLDGFTDGMRTLRDVMRDPEFRAGLRETGETIGDLLSAAARHGDKLVSLAAALVALRFTPGGPVPKAIVGGATGAATFLSINQEVESQIDQMQRLLDTRRRFLRQIESAGDVSAVNQFLEENRFEFRFTDPEALEAGKVRIREGISQLSAELERALLAEEKRFGSGQFDFDRVLFPDGTSGAASQISKEAQNALDDLLELTRATDDLNARLGALRGGAGLESFAVLKDIQDAREALQGLSDQDLRALEAGLRKAGFAFGNLNEFLAGHATQQRLLETEIDRVVGALERIDELQQENSGLERLLSAANDNTAAFERTAIAIEAENEVLSAGLTLNDRWGRQLFDLAQRNIELANSVDAVSEAQEQLDELRLRVARFASEETEIDERVRQFRQLFENTRLAREEVERLVDEFERLTREDVRLTRLEEAVDSLGFTLESSFEQAILEIEKFRDVLDALLQDITKIILRLAVTQPLSEGITGFLKQNLGIGTSLTTGQIASIESGAVANIAANPDIFGTGGLVSGPGTGTSDSILARLSDGEFVVNAEATREHLGLLRAINDNRFPGFQSGGPVNLSRIAPVAPTSTVINNTTNNTMRNENPQQERLAEDMVDELMFSKMRKGRRVAGPTQRQRAA